MFLFPSPFTKVTYFVEIILNFNFIFEDFYIIVISLYFNNSLSSFMSILTFLYTYLEVSLLIISCISCLPSF